MSREKVQAVIDDWTDGMFFGLLVWQHYIPWGVAHLITQAHDDFGLTALEMCEKYDYFRAEF